MTTHAALIEQLSIVGQKAVAAGLVLGSGGNLSARLPGADECVVTASGTWLDELKPEDFSVVGIADGALRQGNAKPSSEAALHLESYKARPDVNAIIHLHPQLLVLLDAMGHKIRLITIDHAYYVREVRSTPYIPSGTPELAQAGAEALSGGCNCVILGHHGCSVVGPTIEAATKSVFNLEEAARLTYTSLMLGNDTIVCPPAYLERIRMLESGQH